MNSTNAISTIEAQAMPFQRNVFLCYLEENAYKDGYNPIEQYFDDGEYERCLCFTDENGQRNGPGMYCWSDGARYQGMFKNDKLHG
jgi:hypothetical protein